MYELYKQCYKRLQDSSKYRTLPVVNESSKLNLNFSSNDYLSLSKREELLDAAIIAGRKYGVGSTGSRLLSGNSELIEDFESRIALDKGTESSLIFNSGFQLNVSVLSSLLDSNVLKDKPLVFFDRLNHASLYQAIFLSGSEIIRYKHNNMTHLSELLIKHYKSNRPKFIVTETIFGMNGTILPLDEIHKLAKEHNAFLYLDEAHATGVIGQNGYGLSTNYKLDDIPYLVMGTFSKALGCSGAYVACNEILKNYLINKAGGLIYTTSKSPMVIGAATKAWSMAGKMNEERIHLFKLAEYLRSKLISLDFNISNSTSHIVSIMTGQEQIAEIITDKLLQQAVIVSSIRPPTVPPGTSRIRLALNTSHSKSDVDQLIAALKLI